MYASYQYIPTLKWGVIAQVPVESTEESYAFIMYSLFILLSIMIIPFSVIIAWFSNRTLRPIQKLYRAVDQVSKGNYEQYVESTDASEIGQLTESFNRMIDSINSQIKRTRG
jgi:two-component system sporulation sensor kinase A